MNVLLGLRLLTLVVADQSLATSSARDAIIAFVLKRMTTTDLTYHLPRLDTVCLRVLLAHMTCNPAFTLEMRVALAVELRNRNDDVVRCWARLYVGLRTGAYRAEEELPADISVMLSRCDAAFLPFLLAPCIAGCWRGVCPALAQRTPSSKTNAIVLAAILSSHDSIGAIDAQFKRYSAHHATSGRSVATRLAQLGDDSVIRPLMANVGLSYRVENLAAMEQQLTALGNPFTSLCQLAERINSTALRTLVRQAMCRWLSWRRRAGRPLTVQDCDKSLIAKLVRDLACEDGYLVANALHLLYLGDHSRVASDAWIDHVPQIIELYPHLSPQVRRVLRNWFPTVYTWYLESLDETGARELLDHILAAPGEVYAVSWIRASSIRYLLWRWCAPRDVLQRFSDSSIRLADQPESAQGKARRHVRTAPSVS